MSNDDALFRFRLRLFALAKEQGSVRAACRLLGVHHSMYYRWLRQLVRFGPEILRPRERRRPRMPNALSPILEQKVLGLALAYPAWGPQRLSSELAREKWGGLKISANGVWRVLSRHGLNTRAKRLGLVAGYAVAHDPPQRPLPEPRHIEANYPGHRVQFDNFYVGRFSGAKGVCWAYIAVDAHTDFAWGALHLTPVNPSARWTSELARRVAGDLSARGWRLEAAMTDNASEFKAGQFNQALSQLGAKHIYIPAGRPQSNGIAERFNLTMLEECWKPAFARYLTPKYTGMRLDFERFLHDYNFDRAHSGRYTQGRTPAETLVAAVRL